AWQQARSGAGGIALLAGEAGIGKSRLLDEVSKVARASGGRVLAGRCFVGESGPPYAPFAQLLAELDGTAELDALASRLGVYAGSLARLLPEWSERAQGAAASRELSPGEERARTYEAVARLLHELARAQPLLLALDDVHGCDADTLGLLRHVARSASRAPL